jgi:hypothetical protein
MCTRLFAGYLLLFLAVLSLTGTALDWTAFHSSSARWQWRAPMQHRGAVQLRQRNTLGILGEAPLPPVLDHLASLPSVSHPDPSPPFLAAIFVPPRV